MALRKIAFFGATGGCANACLAHTLRNDHKAAALARSSQKLLRQLEARQVPREAIETHLTIVEGDVKDVDAVHKTLTTFRDGVDTVISGIGETSNRQFHTDIGLIIAFDNQAA